MLFENPRLSTVIRSVLPDGCPHITYQRTFLNLLDHLEKLHKPYIISGTVVQVQKDCKLKFSTQSCMATCLKTTPATVYSSKKSVQDSVWISPIICSNTVLDKLVIVVAQ